MADSHMSLTRRWRKAIQELTVNSIVSELIKVLVGDDAHVIHTPMKLIESSSEFTKNALKQEWLEGGQRVIRLPEADIVSFTIYIKRLYTGRMDCTPPGNDQSAPPIIGHCLADLI